MWNNLHTMAQFSVILTVFIIAVWTVIYLGYKASEEDREKSKKSKS